MSRQPVKWSAERNERLLLLIIKDIKIDCKKLTKEWHENYGTFCVTLTSSNKLTSLS